MLSVEEAMAQVRKPGILNNDRKLRHVLTEVFSAGAASAIELLDRSREDAHSHGIIAFSDGTVTAV
jgi:hypothetical protein